MIGLEITIDLPFKKKSGSTARQFKWTIKTTSSAYTYSFNIANSVTDYTIDYGDGSDEQSGSKSHKYSTAGTYQITIYKDNEGTFPLVNLYTTSESSIVQSLDTPIPYIDNVTTMVAIFKNCAGLSTVADGLFDNNPQLTSVSQIFMNCRKLEKLPRYIFKKLVNCYVFEQALRGDRSLKVSSDWFCDEATEMTTRFASYTNKVDFSNLLYRVTPQASSNNGTAPELWNYAYGAGVTSSSCFTGNGNSSTTLTNYSSIPSGWK